MNRVRRLSIMDRDLSWVRSKQEFVDYMVDIGDFNSDAAEVIYDYIIEQEGTFQGLKGRDIYDYLSVFDSYEDAVLELGLGDEMEDDLLDYEIEEEAESILRSVYDVIETTEGSIVVLGFNNR